MRPRETAGPGHRWRPATEKSHRALVSHATTTAVSSSAPVTGSAHLGSPGQRERRKRRRGEPEAVQAVRRHRQRHDERHEPGRPMDTAEPSGRPGDAREPAVWPQCRPCLRGRQCQDDAADPRLEGGVLENPKDGSPS